MKMNLLLSISSMYLYMILFMSIMILTIPSKLKNIHPLMIGMIMFIYSILVSMNLNLFNKTSIYSLIMFLIIIGGFMILFLYFNSFAINNKMNFSNKLIKLMMYKIMMTIMMIYLLMKKMNLFNLMLFLNKMLMEMMNLNMHYNLPKLNIYLIYTKFNNLTLFCMIYLLYTLIIVIKIIIFIKPKAIRQMN
uniref:NADH dehydrogenase subunit 6 n=1 Tax=Alloxysta sp. ZJUH_2016001 TaxID=2491149 RepID=A0A3S8V064_9HYME|nr:NADH dehydrogenase subunit 6 [Alloxysta sp. ZJUH_2016001]